MTSSPLNPMQVTVRATLDECPRCHMLHENVDFAPLHYALLIVALPPAVNVELTHWAHCPATGQPVLLGYHDRRWQVG